MKRQVLATWLAAAWLSAAATGVATQRTPNATEQAAETTESYRGGLVSPPLSKPKFTLTDTSGASYDFFAETQGYVTFLFFGYTRCPEICPLQMQMIARALKKVPKETAEQFRVVFVTTDPERDTAPLLRVWLDHFDKRFVGLTGSQSAIDVAQVAASLSPARRSAARANKAYDFAHSAFFLAYTKDNLAHVIYPIGVKEDDLAHDLPYLAKEIWNAR